MKTLEQLLEAISVQSATLAVMLSSAFVGLFGSAMAGAAQFKHGGWGGVVRAMVVGSGVAVIVGLGVSEYISSEAIRFAIVGGCAAIGEDIWYGLKAIGTGIRNDPLGYVTRVIDAFKGRPSAGGHYEEDKK